MKLNINFEMHATLLKMEHLQTLPKFHSRRATKLL